MDSFTQWFERVLFRIGETSITAGTLLRVVLFAAALVWLSSWLRQWLANRALRHFQSMDLGTREAVASVMRYLVLVLGFALILQNAGIRLTALGVVAGAVGVGVGFGLQNIISNFISGMIIMLERPIKVGDPIELAGVSGVVREIGARRTTIVTPDNVAVLVPNQRFITDNVTNLGYLDRPVRLRLAVELAGDTDLGRLRERLVAAAREQPRVLDTPAPELLLTSVGPKPTVELAVWHAAHEPSRQDLSAALNAAIARVLREPPETRPAPAPKPAARPEEMLR
ncbi:mechanosensitive ion channel [Aquincola sp. S2]|uniref:Mechanosensitive ion channel n=1 Tax=Pseudaquabacterium terrae TaxID=2732868 RepID=A0ABX2EHX5_9BURK|nr:mechanosensitive ion channel domain-containing protein [Aquabacterium terrae]NRF68213.1 mechanosensitive ion channel [Aquabacterium terrae]